MINRINSKLSVKLAVIIMFVTIIGVGTITYLSFTQSKKIFAQNSINLIEKNLERYKLSLKDKISSLKYNVTMLAYNSSIKGLLRAYIDPYKYDEIDNKTYIQFEKEVKSIFALMLKQNSSYFQIRVIDPNSGKELIKLIRENGKIIVVKPENLQNKKNRDYVQEAIKAKKNIYISKIDLNREFGKIEFPPKPTLRIAKMIFLNNKKAGLIVINANVAKLLEFDKSRSRKSIHTYIANQNGYYLLNTIEPFKEFGFEFGKNYKLYRDFPKLESIFNSSLKTELIYKNDSILKAEKIYITKDRFIVVAKHTTSSLFDKKADEYFSNLLLYIIIIILFTTLMTAVIVKKFTKPILDLSHIAREIAKSKGEKILDIKIESKDEIGDLANSFKMMLEALSESKKEIQNFALHLEEEVNKKTKELQNLNNSLQKKVDEKLSEIRKKDQTLLQQNKMAAMGEMIGAIAHQWRQPLNALGLNIQMLIDMAEDENCSVEEIEQFVEKNMKTIQFMSTTIDNFRNFFREDKQKTEFDIKEAIKSTVALQEEQLKNHNIKLSLNLQSCKVTGFKNQFMQVILNLVSNAKDSINELRQENNSLKGEITLKSYKKENYIFIEVEDNGKGIPENLIHRIMEPYFTTKEQGKGTGMGLYMSKEIISNMRGDIEVSNRKSGGAKFTITLPLEREIDEKS